ncbi:hypothetical protein [Fulvimarina sp. MAC8]|uniref:AbrB/MazE/SpoVT family DNA-binding domain-containing protein n=1 Tax=Fulvimarina sp. MAC8 TaxID=3162874 RepID=UPI0032EBDB34
MIRVNVLPNGRLVLPVALREKLGVQKGGHLMAELVGGEVHLTTPDAALDRARSIFREYVAPGSNISGEIIADRRNENDLESDGQSVEGERG